MMFAVTAVPALALAAGAILDSLRTTPPLPRSTGDPFSIVCTNSNEAASDQMHPPGDAAIFLDGEPPPTPANNCQLR